jgi:arsenite methyltransferase
MNSSSNQRATYGFDAPYVPIAFAIASLIALALGIHGITNHVVAWWWWASFVWFLGSAGSYVYTTRIGKFRVWSEILDSLQLSGSERVLDVGCGRGAVLIQIAHRLSHGKAVGVDLWSQRDQSGNALSLTQSNAECEGVAERIELHTADMRSMPFEDQSFDLVVSSLAIHNLASVEDRTQALNEILRVLRPGGKLVVADFRHAKQYAERLQEQGCQDVTVRGLGIRFWYGGPFAATQLVTAQKS